MWEIAVEKRLDRIWRIAKVHPSVAVIASVCNPETHVPICDQKNLDLVPAAQDFACPSPSLADYAEACLNQ
jgi:hypothetical protein